jgi:TatD DNase family protein
MKLVDAHTHVQFPIYDNDRKDVLARAKKKNIFMIAVGTQLTTSQAGIELARKYPDQVRATVGYHPNHVSKDWYHDIKEQHVSEREEFDRDVFQKLAQENEVVAIGECGLDYFRIENIDQDKIKAEQKRVFIEQIRIAESLKKPLMIHCRSTQGTDDAYEDLLSVVMSCTLSIPCILHFYAGSLEMTKKFVDAGFYFTFGGVITFARDYDDSIRHIPLSQILLETDAPYVAPKSFRGKKNEPAFIEETAQKLAEIKQIDYVTIQEITSTTAKKLFKI